MIEPSTRRSIKEFVHDMYVCFVDEAIENKFIALGFIVYIGAFELFIPDTSNCLIKMFTGYPCPTCGITRAHKSVLHGDFSEAFHWHPLWFLVGPAFIIIMLRKDKFFEKIFKCKILWGIIIGAVLITYVIRMITVYPNAPMDPQVPIYRQLFDKIFN